MSENAMKTNGFDSKSALRGVHLGSFWDHEKYEIDPFPAPVFFYIDFISSFSRLRALKVGQPCQPSGPASFLYIDFSMIWASFFLRRLIVPCDDVPEVAVLAAAPRSRSGWSGSRRGKRARAYGPSRSGAFSRPSSTCSSSRCAGGLTQYMGQL